MDNPHERKTAMYLFLTPRTLARLFFLFLFMIFHRLKELELKCPTFNKVPQRKAQKPMVHW